MKQYMDAFNLWYTGLQPREKMLVLVTSAILVITLLYLMIWEPVFKGLEKQQELYNTQRNTLAWMQTAASEVQVLKRTGRRPATRSNQPVSLIVEQSAAVAGLKKNVSKLESSGTQGARVIIDAASFDQMLVWLNTLQQQHGVSITSANIERAETVGTVNARLTFDRS